ncbi:YihY/virulence factor BrkB family protein [Sphingomonas montanisoli]|uniref:YihY/virulence factor BrkB family protein n=1 Tax=Sphingomonas montanisoli TaxID=2606412 RepID=A0A5D9CD54_9SPHN|nr:YihY/virulence factor BrkB family protein [Sphingomonas montanisoli]TZG29589.1 YihY/virulence factor BrkB family protein [Sphingomonas montanisoli]
MTTATDKQIELGARAETPTSYGWPAWKAILGRVWINAGRHNVGLMAGGVAFYAFLSFVPLLGALVMTYGLIANPAVVARHMQMIIDLVPADAAKLIYDQLIALTTTAASKKGFGLIIALAVSIYGASRASGGMMSALNVVYEQADRRSFVRSTLIASSLIVGAIAIGIVGVLSASMLGLVGDMVAAIGPIGALIVRIATWLIAAMLASFTIGAMYRFAPDRSDARWQWVSVGALLATVLWFLATIGFGFYAANFAGYDVTYGSLSAIVVLMMWLYISAYAVLIGALVNAEAERQTAVDTTSGHPRPLGERGATVADMSEALQAGSHNT